MPDSSQNGTLLLLGGAGGLGGEIARACASRLPSQPAIITYAYDRDSAESLRDDLGQGHVVQVRLDSADPFSELLALLDDTGLGVSGIVHGAVRAIPGSMLERASDLAGCIQISALSLVHVVAALVDRLLTPASIVYLTSVGSTRVVPDYGAIGIAKATGESIVRYLAHELGPRGIRVNAVGAGPTATKAFEAMFGQDSAKVVSRLRSKGALVPAADESAVARLVSYLIHDDRGTTGQTITVDGGLFLT